MATAPVDDDVLRVTLETFAANERNQVKTALALGIARQTLQNRLKIAARRGSMLDHPPAMPGFRISQVTNGTLGQSIQQRPEHGEEFEVPAGHSIKGVSALLNADGQEIIKWVKTKEGQIDPLAIAESLKAAFDDYETAAQPAKLPPAPAAELLTVLPCNDWHIGMFAWSKEVGENWDLKIAEETIRCAVEDTVARSPSSGHCIVLGGGDLLHADSKRNETTGGTPQDVDGRYQKTIEVASRLMARTIDACLLMHDQITVRILKGNHDEHASVAVAYFLKAWYRNEPRVTVDVDPSDYFWFRFGLVMLGATHGHQSRDHISKMPGIMAHRRAEDWGATKFRYVHGFHLHHSAKTATEGNGVICEIHQAPIPQDAWHFGSGYLSGRSLQAITYHKDFGEIGRVRTAILDAEAQR
jgi:hypothetical protein